jgi:diguanylate cyclase (GGDEF)-like protein
MRRLLKVVAVVLAVGLVPLVIGSWLFLNRERDRAGLDRELTTLARVEAEALENAFERGRSINLLAAHNPVFRDFYSAPGATGSKIERGGSLVDRPNDALHYLERLFPTAIGEACFIDRSGREIARVVRGVAARPDELSPDESVNPFFAPTFALPVGRVYQAAPYVSPDTGEWVISHSTRVPGEDAIVHFEVTVETFRRAAAAQAAGQFETIVVDAKTGRVVLSSGTAQRFGAPLGLPSDTRFAGLARLGAEGVATVDGSRVAFRRVSTGDENANRWIVAAVAPARTWIGLELIPLTLLLVAMGAVAITMGRRWSSKSEEADTDALTGLGNRRRLVAELERAGDSTPLRLVLYDLDGFKFYNDTFGHTAGDTLLARFGERLEEAVRGRARAYRLGGDEFCVVAPLSEEPASLVASTLTALSERGEGFVIGCSHGAVELPREARSAGEALQIADERLYAAKRSDRRSPGRQSAAVLLQVLSERDPGLGTHVHDVGELAANVGELLGLAPDELELVRQAGQLHDIGKTAIPDAILAKPGSLDASEWEFVRQHTVIGERIVSAAPALGPVAALVRSSHERWDGTGYPDGLAGAEIPLGARIVAVCDTFDAMLGGRPYRPARSVNAALAELRRFAGTQFDPAVVEAFVGVLAEPETVAQRSSSR